MDIDSMIIEEKEALIRKGACFICKQIGHIARVCSSKTKRVTKGGTSSGMVQVNTMSTSKIKEIGEEKKNGEDAMAVPI